MTRLKILAVAALAGACFTMAAPKAQAQVSISIGVAPECPYGYYDYAPYACAPYGYYGPEWFTGGTFIGAGPWYHGDEHFAGHVDNHYDVHQGYKGPCRRLARNLLRTSIPRRLPTSTAMKCAMGAVT